MKLLIRKFPANAAISYHFDKKYNSAKQQKQK